MIARTIGSLLGRLSQQNIVMLCMGISALWAVLWQPDVEFTCGRSSTPFPNQRLARVVSYIAGIVLTLGGLWDLWIDWHVGR